MSTRVLPQLEGSGGWTTRRRSPRNRHLLASAGLLLAMATWTAPALAAPISSDPCAQCSVDELAARIGAKARAPLSSDSLTYVVVPAETQTSDGFLPTYRLVVKFRDNLKARVDGQGRLISTHASARASLAQVQAQVDAYYRPLINLPEEKIEDLRRRALLRSGVAQPDVLGVHRVGDDTTDHQRLLRLAKTLQTRPEVEYVSVRWVNQPPPTDLPPTTSSYVDDQGYLDSDNGVHARDAWEMYEAFGEGVRIADCEFSWTVDHEEFNEIEVKVESGQMLGDQYYDHGTAVLGEVVAQHNGYGVDGISPHSTAAVYPEVTFSGGGRRVESVTNAIAESKVGDIVMLEMQETGPGGGYGPAEVDQSVWMVTKMGTDAGIVVIGAAGNGSQDLDSSAYADYRSWGDSGLIMVGAGSGSDHSPLGFSTYGERVNVQGWGGGVMTTGYGDVFNPDSDVKQQYTATFNGTSSATPIVVGAAAVIQGHAIKTLGAPLSPAKMRELLMETGTEQGSGVHIGPLPNIVAAIENLVEPETNPPEVKIVKPEDDVEETGEMLKLPVEVSATDDTGKVKEVYLEVNGKKAGDSDLEEPFEFELELEAGEFEVVAVAVDVFDNVGKSDVRKVVVAPEQETTSSIESSETSSDESTSEDSSTTDDPTTSGDSSGDTTQTTTTDASGEESGTGEGSGETSTQEESSGDGGENTQDTGCGCDSSNNSPWMFSLLTLPVLLRRRRRS